MTTHDPTDETTATDLEQTTVTPVPTAPLTPATPGATAEGPTSPEPQAHEPAVAWAPAVPVKPPPSTTSRRTRRLRWAAAIAVVALVLGASAAVAALLTGSASTATVLGYVPAGTTVYGEVRLDLPGDQRQALGSFLQKFPGFADQSALEGKLDEILDEFVKKASDGGQSYTADIKPWFDGEVAVAIGPLPKAATLQDPKTAMDAFRGLVLISVKDAPAAQAWFASAIAESGVKTTTETYDGVQLTVVHEDDEPPVALAIAGDEVVLVGDLGSVRTAIDSDGNSAFASEPGPSAALDAADQDHVGFVYVALRPLMEWSLDVQKQTMDEVGGLAEAAVSTTLLKAVPDWAAYWMRFERDAMVFDAVAPKPELSIGPTANSTSTIVEHVPASALAVSVANGLGASLEQMLDVYAGDPTFKPLLDQLDQALGLVGGRDAALGWIGDTAIVVDAGDGEPAGGLVIEPKDPTAAKNLFTALGAFIGLGGGSQGVTVRTEDHNGTTITIIGAGDLLGRLGGMGGDVGIMPLPGGDLEIAYAATDQVVVIGTSVSFVKGVLDTTTSTSLARDPQYADLARRVGPGTSSAFLDITAIRGLVEKGMAEADPSDRQKYETDVKPFLAPFDALFAAGSIDGDLGSSTVIISVK